MGENALVPAAGAAFVGDRAWEEIAPQVLLKAQQVKGLWEYFPGALIKACFSEIGAEASFRLQDRKESATGRGACVDAATGSLHAHTPAS